MISKIRDKKVLPYLIIGLLAVCNAFTNEIFIYPNDFAPAGVAGIATMIQYALGIRVGFFNLAINLPLVLIAAGKIGKKYAARSATYIVCLSIANIIFRSMDFTGIAFYGVDGGERLLNAIAAGVCTGFYYSTSLRLGGSTGGTDIVSAIIRSRNPEYNIVWIGFVINVSVAFISFFVYGMQYTPVILCICYTFVSSRVSDSVIRGAQNAIRFDIVTNRPYELGQELMQTLKHGCTMLNAEGMYSKTPTTVLMCVVNKHQISDFETIIAKYPETFSVISSVNKAYGNFKRIK